MPVVPPNPIIPGPLPPSPGPAMLDAEGRLSISNPVGPAISGNYTNTVPPDTGVQGVSTSGDGVQGVSNSNQHAGVSGINNGGGFGVFAQGNPAGEFRGDIHVTGTATIDGDVILSGADFAEEFDLTCAGEAEPGTVMVLDGEGGVSASCLPYDRKVAGVVSGGGDYRPGIVLDKRASTGPRSALALVGKVYCKVDASYAPIEIGDMLTTSPTTGHAMKALDAVKSFGAVIGKALCPLTGGEGLIPVLVGLQ